MIAVQVLASSSEGNCYRITDGQTPLLLECGIPWREIQRGLEFRTHEIAGCLISHEHKDHCKAVQEVMRAGINCYMSQRTAGAADAQGHRVKAVKAREQFQIGSWSVRSFETQHDAQEPLGFLLANRDGDKLLYLTDSYYCRYRFRGLTHIMIECNYALDILRRNLEIGAVPAVMKQRLLRSHFSLENVKAFLCANDLGAVREIHLIHLSDGNSDAERFKREIQEVSGCPVYVAANRIAAGS